MHSARRAGRQPRSGPEPVTSCNAHAECLHYQLIHKCTPTPQPFQNVTKVHKFPFTSPLPLSIPPPNPFPHTARILKNPPPKKPSHGRRRLPPPLHPRSETSSSPAPHHPQRSRAAHQLFHAEAGPAGGHGVRSAARWLSSAETVSALEAEGGDASESDYGNFNRSPHPLFE